MGGVDFRPHFIGERTPPWVPLLQGHHHHYHRRHHDCFAQILSWFLVHASGPLPLLLHRLQVHQVWREEVLLVSVCVCVCACDVCVCVCVCVFATLTLRSSSPRNALSGNSTSNRMYRLPLMLECRTCGMPSSLIPRIVPTIHNKTYITYTFILYCSNVEYLAHVVSCCLKQSKKGQIHYYCYPSSTLTHCYE